MAFLVEIKTAESVKRAYYDDLQAGIRRIAAEVERGNEAEFIPNGMCRGCKNSQCMKEYNHIYDGCIYKEV